MTERHADPRAARLVALFESLTPADLARLHEFYTDEARFKDPFNEVRGVAAIRAVFEHMYASLHEPRFEVLQVLVDGDQAFLTWNFRFRMKRLNDAPQCIHGGSHVQFAPDGRVSGHRDYWDAAEELYEKLPVVGGLMRWLKRQAGS